MTTVSCDVGGRAVLDVPGSRIDTRFDQNTGDIRIARSCSMVQGRPAVVILGVDVRHMLSMFLMCDPLGSVASNWLFLRLFLRLFGRNRTTHFIYYDRR